MIAEFSFKTDESSHAFCEEIVSNMMQIFGICREEAVGRINRHWDGIAFLGEKDLRYHESPEFWAQDIVYGSEVPWHLAEQEFKPKPYP